MPPRLAVPVENGSDAINLLKTSPLEWFGRYQETTAAASSLDDGAGMPSLLGKACPAPGLILGTWGWPGSGSAC